MKLGMDKLLLTLAVGALRAGMFIDTWKFFECRIAAALMLLHRSLILRSRLGYCRRHTQYKSC